MLTRQEFLNKISKARENGKLSVIVTVVTLPKSETDKESAIEVITNYQNLDTKISYLLNAYDDDLCLKSKKDIKLLDCIIL